MKEIAKQHLNNEHLARKMYLISKERVLEEIGNGRRIFSDTILSSFDSNVSLIMKHTEICSRNEEVLET